MLVISLADVHCFWSILAGQLKLLTAIQSRTDNEPDPAVGSNAGFVSPVWPGVTPHRGSQDKLRKGKAMSSAHGTMSPSERGRCPNPLTHCRPVLMRVIRRRVRIVISALHESWGPIRESVRGSYVFPRTL